MLNLDLKSAARRLTLIALLSALMYSTAFAQKVNKPKGGMKPGKPNQGMSSTTNRVICRTLILVFVLSALDLLWTILAIRTGSMREINPIGSQFVDDPLSMTLFKASATAMAVCLLYALRHHLLARKAAWWVCLVCTLVAARWVTFNSMFIP